MRPPASEPPSHVENVRCSFRDVGYRTFSGHEQRPDIVLRLDDDIEDETAEARTAAR